MSAKPRLHSETDCNGHEATSINDLVCSYKGLKAQRQTWIIPGRLPLGHLVLLEGIKGAGKSTVCAAIAAMITGGPRIPPVRRVQEGGVLWLSAEESDAQSVLPRLKAAGCDLGRIHRLKQTDQGIPSRWHFPGHLDRLREAITALSLRLIILDPLSSHLDAAIDLNLEQSCRPVLEQLAGVAQQLQCTICGIRHLGKDRSRPRLDQGLGSVAVAGVARMVLALDQPDLRSTRRVLRVIATNLGGSVQPLEYELCLDAVVPTCIGWRVIPSSEDDPIGDQMEPGDRDTRADAILLLRRLLAKEYIWSRAVLKEAEDAGISARTLRSVKAELGVHSKRIGSSQPARWDWGPPQGGW
jgi:putative DNA primase/helicase